MEVNELEVHRTASWMGHWKPRSSRDTTPRRGDATENRGENRETGRQLSPVHLC